MSCSADGSLVALRDPRPRGAGRIPARLASQGRRGRPRAHRVAGAPGHGVCRTRGAARDHRSLHVHPVPDRVRPLRTVPHPGAGARFLARADDRGHHRPAARGRRRSGARDRALVDAGVARRRRDDPGRGREARLRRGPALQAHPDRLHERPRPHDLDRAAAEALRVLGRRRRPRRGGAGVHRRRGRRRHGRGGPRDRDREPRGDPHAATPPAEAAGGADRGGARDRGRRGVRPRGARRLGRRHTAGGLPAVHDPRRLMVGPAVVGRWRVGDRPRRPRRHDLDGLVLRRSPRRSRARQPGDDRHRRLERGCGPLPGVPGEHERVAHGRGGAGRREDPGHRAGGGGGDPAAARWWRPGCSGTCHSPRSPRW